MSALGFVKTQRLPGGINGEDEIFQKELAAVRGKLASKANQRIYRAGQQPAWLPSDSAIAGSSTAATPATLDEGMEIMQHRVKADLHAAAAAGAGEVSRARRVESAAILRAPAADASTGRRPFTATLVRAGDASDVDEDGDARMGDEEENEEGDDDGVGRHRDGRARRRPVEAAVIVAAPAAASAAHTTTGASGVTIDTSQLEVPEPACEDEEEDEEERAIAERRRRARQKAAEREAEEESARARQMQEEAKKKRLDEEAEEEEEEEEEESSEYESDSDDERRRMMLKPIFRSKAERSTLADRDRLEAEERQLEEDRAARAVARKKESKLLVLAELQREVAAEAAKAAAAGANSDGEPLDEEVDEELELDMWKLRELRRLKRDRDERKAYEEEQAQVERRRHMTDDEIRADNERLGIDRSGAAKADTTGPRFMQRYYHKGGFFQDEESRRELGELATRDFHQPTGADRTVDRTTLPAVMQVKNFAMKGRTKYTHLVDQDTSRREDNPWARRNTLIDAPRPKGAGDVRPGDDHRKKHRT